MKRGFAIVGSILFMVLSFPFAAGLFLMQTGGSMVSTVEMAPQTPTTLVLGAAAYPSRLSEVLQDRMDTALALYNAGKTSTLLLSGAPNEVDKMEEYALDHGVKAEAIEKDPKGLNTLASMQNASTHLDKVLIVTQDFHLPRALYMARRLGIKAVGVSADLRDYPKIMDFRQRELLASVKAIWDLGLGNLLSF